MVSNTLLHVHVTMQSQNKYIIRFTFEDNKTEIAIIFITAQNYSFYYIIIIILKQFLYHFN